MYHTSTFTDCPLCGGLMFCEEEHVCSLEAINHRGLGLVPIRTAVIYGESNDDRPIVLTGANGRVRQKL